MTDQQYYAQAYVFIVANPDEFRPHFEDWLWDNIGLQRMFDAEAIKVAQRGRTHYSAYTIVEYMRHDMVIREVDSEFKINNDWRSSMVRIFRFMYPNHAHLFEFREMHHTAAGV